MGIKGMLKGRKAALATATVATILTGGIGAYAAIPSTGTTTVSSCYDKTSGAVRYIDTDSGAKCNTNENSLSFAQRGPQGWTGPQGPRGQAGPNTLHWAKFSATGAVLYTSDPGTSTYSSADYDLVQFPGVDLSKCAVTVTPVDTDTSRLYNVSWTNWYGYIYARIVRFNGSSADQYGHVALDIQAACPPTN